VRHTPLTRRRFLQGAGGVAIGLPFLEGMPERSAWAQNAQPVFSFYIVAACGVVGKSFFPSATGALTTDSLMAASDKATSILAPHAANLLFVKGINYPRPASSASCGHAAGLCQALTAMSAAGSGGQAYATGPSADVVLAPMVNPSGVEPLNLYAGNRRNGYIAERLSFKGSGAGQVRPADDNPYTLYTKLVGLAGSGGTPTPMANELVVRRKSVNDLVRSELRSLLSSSALSSADKLRLQQHFDAIRDAENTMTGIVTAGCTTTGVSTTKIEALKTFSFKMNGMIEDVAKLHMELVALAFACNFNRVVTMQWGDGTDATVYGVPTNTQLGNWQFHHISHRIQDNGRSGTNATAEAAHVEIDRLRMETFKYGLDQFAARGLFDKSIILWTNHVADGPSHSMSNVPTIIAGSGGGYFKQGQYVDVGANIGNNRLLNTLVYAAKRDKNTSEVNIGSGPSTGDLAAIKV
jgi:hypothetical protein